MRRRARDARRRLREVGRRLGKVGRRHAHIRRRHAHIRRGHAHIRRGHRDWRPHRRRGHRRHGACRQRRRRRGDGSLSQRRAHCVRHATYPSAAGARTAPGAQEAADILAFGSPSSTYPPRPGSRTAEGLRQKEKKRTCIVVAHILQMVPAAVVGLAHCVSTFSTYPTSSRA